MAIQEHPTWECFLDVSNQIGEAPIWSADENALYWIDAEASPTTLNRFAGGSTRSWSFPDRVGTWALTAYGSWVLVALRSGIYSLDLETDALDLLHEPPYDPERFQFNDGRCDRHGNFWVGTMAVDFTNTPPGSDTLWRLGEDGLSQRADGITLSNGTAFSPSGDVLYIADSPPPASGPSTTTPATGHCRIVGFTPGCPKASFPTARPSTPTAATGWPSSAQAASSGSSRTAPWTATCAPPSPTPPWCALAVPSTDSCT